MELRVDYFNSTSPNLTAPRNFALSLAEPATQESSLSMTFALLNKLPRELRLNIFKYLILEWNGKMPGLIQALRPDPMMYGEALDIFFKINDTYIISERNDWGLGDMFPKMALSISKVKIEIIEPFAPRLFFSEIELDPKDEDNTDDDTEEASEIPSSRGRVVKLQAAATALQNVHFVHLSCAVHTIKAWHYFSYSAAAYLIGFQDISKVIIHFPQVCYWNLTHMSEKLWRLWTKWTKDRVLWINEKLGAQGKFDRYVEWDLQVPQNQGALPRVKDHQWVWEADEKYSKYLNEITNLGGESRWG